MVKLYSFRLGLIVCYMLLKRLRASAGKRSHQLQMIFFRAFAVQMLIGCVGLLFLLCLTAWALASGSPASQTIASVYCMTSSFHGVFDVLALMYFVTPYRRFLLRGIDGLRANAKPASDGNVVTFTAWK